MIPPTRLDSDQMNSDPEALSDLNADAKVLVAREQDCVGNRSITSQFYEIGHYERVDSLLPTTAHSPQPDLDVIGDSQILLRLGASTLKYAVIPIDAQQRSTRCLFFCQLYQFGNQGVVVEIQTRATGASSSGNS